MVVGRAAALLVFGNRSTGAQNDIKTATEIARNMVTKWGMSEKLGPLTLSDREEQIFLGREIAQRRDYSEATARLIDSEVKALVDEAEKKAIKILKDNTHILDKLAKALLEKEVLTKNEIEKIIKAAKTSTKRTKKRTKTQNNK